MMTVRFAYYYQSEKMLQALDSSWEQSLVGVRSCKVRNRRIAV